MGNVPTHIHFRHTIFKNIFDLRLVESREIKPREAKHSVSENGLIFTCRSRYNRILKILKHPAYSLIFL